MCFLCIYPLCWALVVSFNNKLNTYSRYTTVGNRRSVSCSPPSAVYSQQDFGQWSNPHRTPGRRGDRGGVCNVLQGDEDGGYQRGQCGFWWRRPRCDLEFPDGRLSPAWVLHLVWMGTHSHRGVRVCQLSEERGGHSGISREWWHPGQVPQQALRRWHRSCQEEKNSSLRCALRRQHPSQSCCIEHFQHHRTIRCKNWLSKNLNPDWPTTYSCQ